MLLFQSMLCSPSQYKSGLLCFDVMTSSMLLEKRKNRGGYDKFTNFVSHRINKWVITVLGYPLWNAVFLLTINSKQKCGTIMKNV